MPRMQSLKGSLNKDGPEERNDLLKFDVRRNMTQNVTASSKKWGGLHMRYHGNTSGSRAKE
jgi:hypothetical protein